MIEIRTAKDLEVPHLKELWGRSFGDPQAFIDFYFAQRFQPAQTLLLTKQERICAMLTLIDVDIALPDRQSLPAGMLYAIATHPDYRQQGLATKLMAVAHDYLKERGKICSIIVPATLELFDFYRRQGYREGFAVRELKMTHKELELMIPSDQTGQDSQAGQTGQASRTNGTGLKSRPGHISAVTPEEYNYRRETICQSFKETPYISYQHREIAYQQKLSQFSGADIYGITIGEWAGCAAVERYSKEKVIIKELLLPDVALRQGIRLLAETLHAEEYTIRTPAHLGQELGGAIRPFGMALSLQKQSEFSLMFKQEQPLWSNAEQSGGLPGGYLGLAFD